jgi:hypothetical protein
LQNLAGAQAKGLVQMASYYASSAGSSADNDEEQVLTSAAGSGSAGSAAGLLAGPSRSFAMSLYPTKVGVWLMLHCSCCELSLLFSHPL